jgi:methylglutaconyl-CoA hydratase
MTGLIATARRRPDASFSPSFSPSFSSSFSSIFSCSSLLSGRNLRNRKKQTGKAMTDTTSVILEKRGQAYWITINRPEKRNALNAEVIAGIAKGYREAHEDKEVRVIVLTGAGDKAFCAGADLQHSGAAFAMDFSKPNADYADLLRLSQNATKPAIARLGGVCMAGGMGLLCMTDMAVAADHVIFGLPEVKVGVFPMQVLSLLQSIVPRRLVSEWALTGEPFDAKQALSAGLLNYIVPSIELDAKIEWLIGRIVDKSPTAIRRGKYAMRAIASMSFDESIAYTESQIAILAMTEDAKEGLTAFSEKRKPVWPGK